MNLHPPLTVTLRGSQSTIRFSIEPGQRVVVGRDPTCCDVVVPSLMTRQHVALENVAGRCVAEMIACRYNLYLAGRAVLQGKGELPVGQEMRVADHLWLTVEPPAENAPGG